MADVQLTREPEKQCPKCGSRQPWRGPTYTREVVGPGPLAGRNIREYLLYSCGRCDYGLKERCADARPVRS